MHKKVVVSTLRFRAFVAIDEIDSLDDNEGPNEL